MRRWRRTAKGLTFLQISDSHMGFDKPANPNAKGTLEEAIGRIKALPEKPAFMIHTGDITHLSKVVRIRRRRKDHLAGQARRALRAGRARHHRRGRQALPRALRPRHQGRRLVQLRRRRRALRRPGQRQQPQGRRHGQPRRRAARSGSRTISRARLAVDADRGVRAHPAVGGVPAVGLGHRGRRPRARHPQAASARSPCSTATSIR